MLKSTGEILLVNIGCGRRSKSTRIKPQLCNYGCEQGQTDVKTYKTTCGSKDYCCSLYSASTQCRKVPCGINTLSIAVCLNYSTLNIDCCRAFKCCKSQTGPIRPYCTRCCYTASLS